MTWKVLGGKCEDCKKEVKVVKICPDGAERCPDCYKKWLERGGKT